MIWVGKINADEILEIEAFCDSCYRLFKKGEIVYEIEFDGTKVVICKDCLRELKEKVEKVME
jgi:hypothetical protein